MDRAVFQQKAALKFSLFLCIYIVLARSEKSQDARNTNNVLHLLLLIPNTVSLLLKHFLLLHTARHALFK